MKSVTKFHPAPWSPMLKGISVLATCVCAGVALVMVRSGGPAGRLAVWGLAWLVLGALLFTVRGYRISGDAVRVQRLFWSTRLPLAELVSAQADPQAMRDSLRVFGNGGFFSITGRFHNERLGRYRAFVTDPSRAVVLRYPDRVVVVSPASPENFVIDLQEARGRLANSSVKGG